MADLYVVLFDNIVSHPDKTGHGWEGFYFGENGEHSWYQISRAIGDAFVALGVAAEAEPTSFTSEELVRLLGSEQLAWSVLGANSRCRAHRGRAIGWKPTHTTEDFLKSIALEVEALTRQ